MALLDDQTRQEIGKMLANLPNPVRLLFFSTPQQCEYCDQIRQLTAELTEVSNQISLETYDFTTDLDKVAEYKIDKAPALAVVGEKDYGVRFFGFPAGYEFSTMLHAIQAVSRGVPELDSQMTAYLQQLSEPVHIQVFVTTSCPYCPRAAVVAYEMALASDMVKADVVEAGEFPQLANQYEVMGVPLSVINGIQRVEGAAPAHMVFDAIKGVLANP
jgi:glutaredoxin-like protein